MSAPVSREKLNQAFVTGMVLGLVLGLLLCLFVLAVL